MPPDLPPSQFYTGLIAQLYEPLISQPPRADDVIPFLDLAGGPGTPALELACGTGLPMLELIERGYRVEGLDASADMLRPTGRLRCVWVMPAGRARGSRRHPVFFTRCLGAWLPRCRV